MKLVENNMAVLARPTFQRGSTVHSVLLETQEAREGLILMSGPNYLGLFERSKF